MNSDANNYDDDANYKEKRKAVHRVVNLFENFEMGLWALIKIHAEEFSRYRHVA